MKKILRIVITGGPCGGKTTALEEISKIFRTQGYTVMVVNETATELINDGVKPFGNELDKLPIIDFQTIVLEAQLSKEKVRDMAANACLNDNVVILYDRGILDNRAYLTDDEFKAMIDKRGITEAQILSRYDLVLHLVTAAQGQEKYYTTANNTARIETPEEAREKDKRTMETWSNHPNLKIFGNDCLFDEKIHRVGNAIRAFLGENEVIEQRKYKVSSINYRLLSNYLGVHMLEEEICEFATCYDIGFDELYRKSTISGSNYYIYTIIKYNPDGTKTTRHRNITEDDFNEQLGKIEDKPITKTRYNFIYNGERYRIDVYHDTSLITLERDVTNSTNVELPNFVKVGEEITDQRDYRDANIFKYVNQQRQESQKESMYQKLGLRKQD